MPLDGKKHAGHRERLKQRFAKEGLDSFEEHNILELLLFYTIPQKDTNELAHDLLDRFGSLDGVFNASKEELLQVKGVGEHTALFFSLFPGLMDIYLEDRKQNNRLSGVQDITEFAVRKLADLQTECLLFVFMDNKQIMLNWMYIQEDGVSLEKLDFREIITMILHTNATQILVGRNILKGKIKVGNTDMKIAEKLSLVLRPLGVGLFDYIVTGAELKIDTVKGNADFDIKKRLKQSKVGDQK